jgi:tetratricopeptide (TPR) repeat protein
MVGLIYSILGNMKRAERVFAAAYRVADGCSCCQPVLDRHYGLSLSLQGRHAEAIEHARRALAGRGPDKGLRVLALGFAYYHARDSRAAPTFIDALERFAPDSAHYRQAFVNLGFALAFADAEYPRRVMALLPDIKKSFSGIRGLSVQRAALAWLEGGIHAANALKVSGSRREQKSILCESRDLLEIAFGRYMRLKFYDKAGAVWSEMLALQVYISFADVATWLEKYPYPFNSPELPELSLCAKSKDSEASARFLSVLETIRFDNVADPSLITYETKRPSEIR